MTAPPVGLYVAAHASPVVSKCVVCWRLHHDSPVRAEIRMETLLLLEPRTQSRLWECKQHSTENLFNMSVH